MNRPLWCIVTLTAAHLLAGCAIAREGPREANGGPPATMNATALRMFELVNLRRVGHGLPPLKVNDACVAAAQSHSENMAALGYFSHNRLTQSFIDRMRRWGLASRIVGENLGWAATPDEVVEGFMHSPSHRSNILNPGFVSSGIGFAGGKFTQCLSGLPGN